MSWLDRNSWWCLLLIGAANVIAGLAGLVVGDWYQAVDVTGRTMGQITAESASGAELAEFAIRMDGLHLVVLGAALVAVLAFGYRRGQRWAWWVAWLLPVMAAGTSALHLAYGATGPAISGSVVGVLAAAILVAEAPRFLRAS